MKRLSLLLFLAIAFIAGLSGCGSNDVSEINAVSHDFLTAIEKHDNTLLRSTLTDAARSQTMPLDMSNSRSSSTEAATTELGSPNIKNNLAEISFNSSVHGRSVDKNALRLRKEKDGWRVYAMVINASQNSSKMVLDFEHPESLAASVMTQAGEAIGTAVKGLSQGLIGMAKSFGDSFHAPPKPMLPTD